MHLNYVPADPRFTAAAIAFVVNARGCGPDEFSGTADEALEFLEMFELGDLIAYPEFFSYCESQGLPVVRDLYVAREPSINMQAALGTFIAVAFVLLLVAIAKAVS